MALKQVKKTKRLIYTAIFEPQPEGGYTVTVPALPGCTTEGETLEEARWMAKDAIECYIASLLKHNEPIPKDVSIPHQPVMEKVSIELQRA